jgi:ferredoxin
MADVEEVKVQGLTIQIRRNGCAGFKDCIKVAPEAFDLAGDGVVRFTQPDSVDRDRLIEACRVCPADALIVLDEEGRQIVP